MVLEVAGTTMSTITRAKVATKTTIDRIMSKKAHTVAIWAVVAACMALETWVATSSRATVTIMEVPRRGSRPTSEAGLIAMAVAPETAATIAAVTTAAATSTCSQMAAIKVSTWVATLTIEVASTEVVRLRKKATINTVLKASRRASTRVTSISMIDKGQVRTHQVEEVLGKIHQVDRRLTHRKAKTTMTNETGSKGIEEAAVETEVTLVAAGHLPI